MTTPRLVFPAAVLALALFGCTEGLHHDLTEKDANELYVLLTENGISAKKERQPGNDEPLYMIKVPKQDLGQATKLIGDYSLPRPKIAGFRGIREGKGMIPTQVEERAMFLEALGGEISSALNRVDGVLEAHAIVMLPERNDLAQPDQKPKPSASVLVRYRTTLDGRPPLDEQLVRAFAAAAVEELQPEDVRVIMSQAVPPSAELNPEAALQDVLWLRMTKASASQFKTMMFFSLIGVLALIGFTIWSLMRGGSVQQPARRSRPPEA